MSSRSPVVLSIARDADRMRTILEQHVRSISNPSVDVADCAIVAAPQQQGRSSIQYRVVLRDAASGREHELTLNCLLDPSDRSRQSFQDTAIHQPEPVTNDESVGLPAFSYLPDLDMIIQVFPHDLRLPALAPLLQGNVDFLAPRLLARFGPGNWRVRGLHRELVVYRIGMTATVRLTVQVEEGETGHSAERRFYAKVYQKRQDAKNAFRQMEELAGRGGGAFVIGHPVGFLAESNILIQEEVAGTYLLDILRSENDVTAPLRHVARAVAALHNLDLKPPAKRWRRNRIARLGDVSDTLLGLRPELATEIEETVRAVTARLDGVVSAPTHGDLKPEHILLDGERVGLIDWDLLATADPAEDVANFLFLMRREVGRSHRGQDRWQSWQRVFAEEYFSHVPGPWANRLPAHYAAVILTEAATSRRGQRVRSEGSRRTDVVTTMIREAREAVSGRWW